MKQIVNLIPDFNGVWTSKEGWKNDNLRGVVIPVLNGKDHHAMEALAALVESDTIHPLVSAQGVRSALEVGYTEIINKYSDFAVVRGDTAEHPWQLAPEMASMATTISGIVVCDMIFPESLGLMPPHELCGDKRYRKLTSCVSRGFISVGGAHGFMALAPKIIQTIMPEAIKIVEIVEDEFGPMQWGFDLCVLLSAIGLGLPVVKMSVIGIEKRDRKKAKVDTQFFNGYRLCEAAAQVFPERLSPAPQISLELT